MKTTYAKDFKCCKCKKKQAVCFWPAIDVDIPNHPYCRKCVDKVKMEALLEAHGIELHFGSGFTLNNLKNE